MPLGAIGAIVVLIAVGAATMTRHSKTAETAGHPPPAVTTGHPPTTEKPPKPDIQAPGPHTPARSGGLQFDVTGVESGVHNIGRVNAKGSFTIVTMNVTNTDDMAGNFFTNQQQLVDSTGRVIDEDTRGAIAYRSAHPEPLRLFGTIDAGQTITTCLVFDLPAGTTPGYLQVRDGPVHPAVMVALS